MGLKEVLNLQRELSNKIGKLCKRPVANSQEQVNEWQNNNIEYLKLKSKNVQSISNELENDIDIMFEEHRKTYYHFVESWYEYGFKNYQNTIIRQKKIDGDISIEKMRDDRKKIKSLDTESISQEEKIDYLFFVFESIINAINKQSNWFDIYKGSSIRGDGLVFNVSSLDLFAWQLPNADLRNKNDYKNIAKIMTIFYFIENIYKNENCLSNEVNPFDKIMNLDKVLSYYFLVKEKN